jgi:ubiquinone/menaquinone biosynthesis C-methylase UbiE
MIMEFDKYADNYDAGFMGKGSGRFYADLIKEIDVKDGDAVLDVGCGTGTVLSFIGRQKKIRGFGLDVSENMIAIAKEKIRIISLFPETVLPYLMLMNPWML